MVFSLPDIAALGFFLLAWVSYSMAVRLGLMQRQGLNHSMDQYRTRWMEEMSRRDVRIVDSAIMASLQNGAAFFTSTSLIAILIGATPARADPDGPAREAMVRRASRMNIAAGSHFTRGQRALFFALAYFGWFLGPYAFMATTAAVIVVMGARQFSSDARRALEDGEG